MAAVDTLTPTALAVVKVFAYSFRSAPTGDLLALGRGITPAALLDVLFNYPAPQTPFAAYRSSASNTEFVTAMVENFTVGTSIGSATKTAWINELVPIVGQYPSRGAFVATIATLVDTYNGPDANLLALKANLASRVETAAAFAQSPAGALYNGQGFAQLMAPLLPPPAPTYDLTAGAASVNEGNALTFTLQTTNVAAGTDIAYTLTGSGITTTDVIGGQLTGKLTVNAAGAATTTISFTSDFSTEGPETLRMTLADNRDQLDVVINDTSVGPTLPGTFALSANVTAQNEGGSVVYTLTTSNVPAGTVVPFLLVGTTITAADFTNNSIAGNFTVDAQGRGTATVQLAADATTEGPELLRMRLNDGTQTDITINDTSVGPAPTGSADTVIVADVMPNSGATIPPTPLAGEMLLNSYLNYDLLNQAGNDNLRLTLAQLRATSPTAGAALNTTNFSADRGNIAQVSNQTLFTYDLGLLTDRVDYSAETGKIVALVSAEALPGTQYILVNDNGTDDNFAGALDRIDTLKSVEQIVASAGGGVLDLTNSGQNLQITFSRNFNSNVDVDAARDRETRRVELSDLGNGTPLPIAFLEFRDAGGSGTVTQATAAWTTVQGSDRNETIVFTGAESMDQRSNVLRGGNNSVKFNELTRSILVDVAITPWVEGTNPADDTNTTGRLVATTRFTTGDGVTLLSAATTVTSSHTPDNRVAAGKLLVVGSQDAEDAITFSGSNAAKVIVLGQSIGGADGVSVRVAGTSTTAALEFTGFELLSDNGASDDLYVIDNIAKATLGSPKLSDGAGNDHDAVKLGNEALGSPAVGGVVGTINLAILNGATPGFGFDFDVLDISAITATGLQVLGTAGSDDELVVGPLGTLATVSGFESIVLTNASIDKGTSLTLDLDAGVVKAGPTTLFNYGGSALSAGGLMFGTAGQTNLIDPTTVGFAITIVDTNGGAGGNLVGGAASDTLTGASGNDRLRGGGGDDLLDAGAPAGGFAETHTFPIAGTPDATAAAANRITITMTIDGTVLTLSEAAVSDITYSDGNGAFVDGSSLTTIGAAMTSLINANLGAINAGPGTGTLSNAIFDGTGTVRLNYVGGIDANDVVSFVLNSGAGPDAGNFTLGAGVNFNGGGSGGNDTFVFESTAAKNGRDLISGFTGGSDKLDVTAFTGAPITLAGPSINATNGGTLAGVATTAEFIFNKAGGTLSASDFATVAAAGKFVIADGGRSVVAVSADLTGARGDAANTAMSLYYVENGAVAGLGDLTVSLVGTINGPQELTLAQVFTALTP